MIIDKNIEIDGDGLRTTEEANVGVIFVVLRILN